MAIFLHAEYVIPLLGVIEAGLVPTTMNPNYTAGTIAINSPTTAKSSLMFKCCYLFSRGNVSSTGRQSSEIDFRHRP